MRYTLSAVLLAAIVATGCKKTEQDTPAPTPTPRKSNYEYLIQKPWYIAEQYITAGDGITNPAWADVKKDGPECYYDNTILFGTNGTIYYDNGPTKCYESDAQVDSLETWFFDKSIYGTDSNYIKIQNSMYTTGNHIMHLDDDVLDLHSPAYFGEDSTIRTVYRHK